MPTKLSPEMKAAIDQVAQTKSTHALFEVWIDEVEAEMRKLGIPEDLLQGMRDRHEVRASYMEAARKLIHVQELPPGALPIYDREPEEP